MSILPKSALLAWAALGCLASPLEGASIELTSVREILYMPSTGSVALVISSNGLPGQFEVPTVSSRFYQSVPPYFSDTKMSYSITSFVSNTEIQVDGINVVDASFNAKSTPEGIDEANGFSHCDLAYAFAVTNPVEFELSASVDAQPCFSFVTDTLFLNLWPYVRLDFTTPTGCTVVWVGTDVGSAACLESTNNVLLRGILPVGQSTLTLESEAYGGLRCLDQCSYAAPTSVSRYHLHFRARDIPVAPVLQFIRQGDELVLSWPVSATNFVLESTATVGTSAAWLEVTNTPIANASNFQVTIGTTNSFGFYRLRHAF